MSKLFFNVGELTPPNLNSYSGYNKATQIEDTFYFNGASITKSAELYNNVQDFVEATVQCDNRQRNMFNGDISAYSTIFIVQHNNYELPNKLLFKSSYFKHCDLSTLDAYEAERVIDDFDYEYGTLVITTHSFSNVPESLIGISNLVLIK